MDKTCWEIFAWHVFSFLFPSRELGKAAQSSNTPSYHLESYSLCPRVVTEHWGGKLLLDRSVGGEIAPPTLSVRSSSSPLDTMKFLSLHITASICHCFSLSLCLLKSSLDFEQSIKKQGVTHRESPWMRQRPLKPRGTLTTTPVILNISWGKTLLKILWKLWTLPQKNIQKLHSTFSFRIKSVWNS